MTTYRVALTMMGCAIVMKNDEGFETVIEYGIKSVASATKKCDRWTAKEVKARAKEAKRLARFPTTETTQ